MKAIRFTASSSTHRPDLSKKFRIFFAASSLFYQFISPFAHADTCPDDPSLHCIYYQSFDNLTPANDGTVSGSQLSSGTSDPSGASGWYIDSLSGQTVTLTAGHHGYGVVLNDTSAQSGISILASKLFGGQQMPAAGTISFWFKPYASSSDTDWVTSGLVNRTHKFFNIKDTSNSHDILGLQKHHSPNSSPSRSYLALNNAINTSIDDTSIDDQSTSGPSANWTTQDDFHLIEVTWDTTNKYIALIIDGNYIRESMLSNADAAAIATSFSSQTIFTLGNNGAGSWGGDGASWSLSGVIDDIKIYNIAKYGFRNPDQYKTNAVNNGVREPWETPENSPADAMLKQFSVSNGSGVFFTTPTFKKVTENTLPDATSLIQNLKVNMQPGETLSVFINYYNGGAAINSTNISVSDFALSTDSSKLIANPELFVVSNWFQAGEALNAGGLARYVPELLLTQETPSLNGYSNSKAPGTNTDALPNLPVPSKSVSSVKLPKNSSRQFMLRLTAPVNATTGDYNGNLMIGSVGTLPIQVHINTVPLAALDKDALVYHQAYSDAYQNDTFRCPGQPDFLISQSLFEAQLTDLKNHGMNGEMSFGFGPTNASLIQQHGLDKTIVLINPYCKSSQALQSLAQTEVGLFTRSTPYFQTQDEIHLFPQNICNHIEAVPNFRPPALIATTTDIALTESLKNQTTYAGCPNADTGPAPIDLMSIEADAGGIDALHYLATSALAYPSAPVKHASKSTYYWQLFSEDGRLNRFNAGYFLWLTGMDGIFPYGYMPDNTPSAFNDFAVGTDSIRKDQAVYPSANGSIATIQWEALREGLNDYRYLLTWKNIISTANLADPNQAAIVSTSTQNINKILKHYQDGVITPLSQNCGGQEVCYYEPDQSAYLHNVLPQIFADDREAIREEIKTVAAALGYSQTFTVTSTAHLDSPWKDSRGGVYPSGTNPVSPAPTVTSGNMRVGQYSQTYGPFNLQTTYGTIRGVVGFNLVSAGIPQNATIKAVTLTPSSPSSSAYNFANSGLVVDVAQPKFGNQPTIESDDFNNTATAAGCGTWSVAAKAFNLTCLSTIQAAVTNATEIQFRVQLPGTANSAGNNNYVDFAPVLNVTYTRP